MQHIKNALLVCEGDVETSALLLTEPQAGPRFMKSFLEWFFPTKENPQRYRLTRDAKIQNLQNTSFLITLPILGKPKYMVKTAQRQPWPYKDLDWIMAVRNSPRTVLIVSPESLPYTKVKDIVKEIQTGVNNNDIKYIKAFQVKHVNIGTQKTKFKRLFDSALEFAEELIYKEYEFSHETSYYRNVYFDFFDIGANDLVSGVLYSLEELVDEEVSTDDILVTLYEGEGTNTIELVNENDETRDYVRAKEVYSPEEYERLKLKFLELQIEGNVQPKNTIEFMGDILHYEDSDEEFMQKTVELATMLFQLETAPKLENKQMGGVAYYDTTTHTIYIPDSRLFKSGVAYMRVLFHEYGHSTPVVKKEKPTRYEDFVKRNRKPTDNLNDLDENIEELRAELIAHLLLSEIGFHYHEWTSDVIQNRIMLYITSYPEWARKILIIEAARNAAFAVKTLI